MTIEDFGKTIQAKYPQYADKPAADVGNAMLKKYPQYQSKIDQTMPKEEPTHVKQSFMQKLGSAVIDPLKGGVQNVKSIGQGIGQSFKTATQQSGQDFNDAKGKSSIQQVGAGFQAVGNFSKAALSPLTETIGTGVNDIGTNLSQNKGFSNFANSKIGNALASANIPGDKYSQWATQHPEAAKNLEALGNITALGTSIPAGVEAGAMASEKGTMIGNTAKDLSSGMGKEILDTGKSILGKTPEQIAKAGSQDVLDIVKPKLTPTEEAMAKASGRGGTKGLLKTTEIKPTSQEVEMANVAKDAGVSSKNTFDQNIKLMKQAQADSAGKVRAGLQDNQSIWNKNGLKSILEDVKKPITVKNDATINKIADGFKKAALDLADNVSKKEVGKLDLRQNLDTLIDKEFPKNIYTKDTPIGQYVRSVRQALNDWLDKDLQDGTTIKAEFRKQSLLYNAIDNVAEKAPKVGESARPIAGKIKNFAKKHPIATGALSALGAERILKNTGLPLP